MVYSVQVLNTETTNDQEYVLLENIYQNGKSDSSVVGQRDLAVKAGISLGMTNAILKRLAQKGWVTVRRLNGRNFQYAVSPAGLDEIARRSYRFLKRTIRNVVVYKDAIDKFAASLRHTGCKGIVLVGQSDLSFLIEHCCAAQGIQFARSNAPSEREGFCQLFSEEMGSNRSHAGEEPGPRVAYLNDLLIDI
jgi:DNA-binding MarR family transcriptional regulator